MTRKNLVNLSEIPVGNVTQDGDDLVGYRSSLAYRGNKLNIISQFLHLAMEEL